MKKHLSFIIALIIVMQYCFVIPQAADVYTPPEAPSTDYNFNPDWKFSKPYSSSWPLKDAVDSTTDSAGHKFYEPSFDDSLWKDVSLPHTFNDEDSFRNVANDAGDSGSYRGIAFYRKHFRIPEEHTGKKVIIEFEGARQGTYVYVNGEMAGYYEAGITPFGMDITKYIKYGEENVIAVALDNTSSRGMTAIIAETKPGSVPGSNDGAGFQWNTKDFNPDMGGLTRNVILHIKNTVYETLPLYSNLRTKGTYIYADSFDIRGKKADIHIETEVRNESGTEKNLSLEAVVVDNDGNVAVTMNSEKISVSAAEDTDKNYDLSIIPADAYDENPVDTETESLQTAILTASASADNLRFWSPDDPYLYTVYTILKSGDDVVDVVKTTTGFRKTEAKSGADGGIYINDKYYWLTGYAQRSANEWAAIGVANDWLKDYDAQLIKESNANFIRWMHIAAQPADIRSFDKYGIVCVQPAGDKEGDVAGRQWDQRVEVMRDTIIYFRNSPSIIFYESGNSANSAEHMKEMTELRKKLDPNGGRYMGSRSIIDKEAVTESEYVGTMLGRNVWNGSEFTEDGHAARDARAIVETEYHREESPRRVWDDFSPPDFDYRNAFSGGSKISYKDAYDLTAEDFVLSDAAAYNEFWSQSTQVNSQNPFYSATAALCWSDSAQHGRQQGTENARMSGRVDPVRIKKQSFYAYQTMQSDEPSLYIVGHWNYPTDKTEYVYEEKNEAYEYTGETSLRDPEHKTVYVIASNVDSVKLFVNGKEKGECKEAVNGFVYSFPDIDVTENGYIEAVAYGGGKELVRQRIDTAGEPAKIRLTPVTGPEGWLADGADIAYVDVEVVDENGNICPLDYDRIDFEVSGPAVMLGGYNSGVKDLNHSNNYVYAECGTNRIFLRATRNAGEITITAKRAGLQNTTIKLGTTAFNADNGLTTVMPKTRAQGLSPEPPKAESAVMPMLKLAKTFKVNFGINTAIRKAQEKTKQTMVIVADGKEINADAYKMQGVYGDIEAVLKALSIEYNISGDTLKASYGGNTIETTVRNSEMTVNGEPSIINDWPEFIDGVLYAEISAIASNLGLNVKESEGRYEIWK
ncbi:MAG: beta galactosidase jelly roll domain-containing protein [Oscillospiraceae bacterium]|nr:beta galactosidase jelly roll domain-containing protein [Oscillospiraceae bacterium]